VHSLSFLDFATILFNTLQDGSEILCSGTLTLSRARPPDYGPVISWTQDPQNPAVGGGGSDDSCGSLPGKVSDALILMIEIMVNLKQSV
jgi:hypothetical protein